MSNIKAAVAQEDIGTTRSPLDLLVQRLYWVHFPAFSFAILVALSMTLAAGWVAVQLAQEYYRVAPYHFDSAAFQLQSVAFYKRSESEGLGVLLWQSLQTKDSLDLTLRLLFAPLMPRIMLSRFGHLAVLLPFMSAFIFLLIWYIHLRARSVLLGMAVAAFLFIFPLIYSPYGAPNIGGIADYWKDNIAVWLLGSAIVSWLLSRTLEAPRWSFLCGLLLGLLAIQRTAVAVYVIMLFIPLGLWAIYQRIYRDGWRQGLLRIGIFALPALILGGVLISLQWQSLYTYYFVAGYSYGNPKLVAAFLVGGLAYIGLWPFLLVLGGVYLLCILSHSSWPELRADIIVAAWFVVGLPLIIITTSTFYPMFYMLWVIPLVILLATLVPRNIADVKRSSLAKIMLFIVLPVSVAQYHVSSEQAHVLAERFAPVRQLYADIANIVVAQPEPRRFAFFFDEVGAPFLAQLFYENHVYIGGSPAFMSIHDTFYRASYGNLALQEIANMNIRNLEQQDGTLAVGYCEPTDVLAQPNFQSDGLTLAAPYTVIMNNHLLHSLNWKAIHKLRTPYGCLYAYSYSKQPMGEAAKWQDVAYSSTVSEISLVQSLAPSVRVYNYSSRYQSEQLNGTFYQWLPSGKGGLSLSLFSDQDRQVMLRTMASAGPANASPVRTLVVSDARGEHSVQVNGVELLHIPIVLHAGLNQIELSVREPVTVPPPPGGDQREVLLLLTSPMLEMDAR